MKQVFITTFVLLIGIAAGLVARPHLSRDTQPASADSKQLWTCSMHPQVLQDHAGLCPICHMELTPVKSSDAAAGVVTIDPIVVQNMGVRTDVVAEGALAQEVRVVGYLEEPEPAHLDINLRVGGWIEKLHANIDGMDIRKGEKLFDLYSPELSVAVDECIAARRQLNTSPTDTTVRSLIDAATRKLTQYGLTPEQIESFAQLDTAPATISILSPIDGHLTAKMVNDGSAVKAGDLVMRLANRRQLWVETQVFESQLSLIRVGANAEISVTAQPGKIYMGNVIFIHPHVDPATRTAMVRIVIENKDMQLRQGMHATARIHAGDLRPYKLVPREAVIDTGKRQTVFVSLGDGKFEPRDVTLGLAGAHRVQVLTGLELGERVVTSGQFLLDTESRLRESIAKQSGIGIPVSDTPIPQTQPLNTSERNVPHADDLLAAYLAIQRRLGQTQESDAPIDLSVLLQHARLSSAHVSDDARPLIAAVIESATAMQGTPLDDQRKAFVTLSEAMIAIAETSSVASTLYVIKCPMAFGNAGARWLQTSDIIANPYYATEMKPCGSVEYTIESKK